MPDRPILFVFNQVIKRLGLTGDELSELKEYLLAGKMLEPEENGQTTSGGQTRRQLEPRSPWIEQDRTEYLANLDYSRLCITSDAGFGKSVAVEQAKMLRQAIHPEHWVIKVDLDRLPNRWSEYLDTVPATDCFLVDQLHQVLTGIAQDPCANNGPAPPASELVNWLRTFIRRGQLTLIVDGLDQTSVNEGKLKTAELRRFLQVYKKVNCIVAGRPYSIEDFWKELFADAANAESKSSAWEFALVEEFTPEEIKWVIGTTRYNKLKSLGAHELLVPRTLRVIHNLSDTRFARVETAADVYWESVEETMRVDFEIHRDVNRTDLGPDEVIDLFSLIAYGLMAWKDSPVLEIHHGEYDNFVGWLFDHSRKMPRQRIWRWGFDEFNKRLTELAMINSSWINYAFLEKRDIKELRWRNATLRDFFAALYFCRCAADADREWLGERLPIRATDWQGKLVAERCQHHDFFPLWKHICEMPPAAMGLEPVRSGKIVEPERQVKMIAKLFDNSHSARPSEMIYLAWPRLLRWSGWLNEENADIASATLAAQHAAEQPHSDSRQPAQRPDMAGQLSLQIIADFLGAYPALRYSTDPSNAAARNIIDEDAEQFEDLTFPDNMEFRCGHPDESDNPERADQKLERKFSLCKYPMTRRAYWLFDKHHTARFDNYLKYSPYKRSPAIYVSWFDAWCCCLWFSGFMLNEWEWEFAARGGFVNKDSSQPVYYFGDDENELGEYAWHDGNSREQISAQFVEAVTEKLRANIDYHAHTVGTKKGNRFQLHDMLGNVWEWCDSWYSETTQNEDDLRARCLRGGSFLNLAYIARCSKRFRNVPAYAYQDLGFRVARASLRKP